MCAARVTNHGKFLTNVYEAAQSQGAHSRKCIDLLRAGKLDWDNEDVIKPVAAEFRLGHIAGYLSLPSRDDAVEIAEMASTDRTAEQQRAYRASVSAWSHVRLVAGAPNKHSGEERPPRTSNGSSRAENDNTPAGGVPATIIKAVKSPQALEPVISNLFPKAAAPEDVSNFAAWLCDTITSFEKRNLHVKMGEYRTLFHEFVSGARALNRQQKTGTG